MSINKKFKNAFLIFVFSITATCGFSQDWYGGLDGGLTISSIKVVNETDYATGDFSPRLGLHLGIFGEYGFSERWFAQLWLNYDQRGAKFKDSRTTSAGQSYSTDLKLRTHYFGLPLMIKFNFLSSEKVDLFGQFGPEVSFLGWAKMKGTETLDGSTSDIDVRLNDTWSLVTTSLVFGLGFEFNHSETGNTFVQVQYNLGLSDIQQQGFNEQYTSDPEARDRTISITVGYRGMFGE